MNGYKSLKAASVAIVIACVVIAVIGAVGYVRVQRATRVLQGKLASYRSAQSIAEMTLADAATLIASRQSGGATLCELVNTGLAQSHNDMTLTTIRANYCGATLAGDPGNDHSFTDLYLKAVGFRLSGDFAKAGDAYGQALAILQHTKGTPQPEWKARASEGKAYALYRQNDLAAAAAQADDALNSARQAHGGMVFAAITWAKITCARNGDRAAVARRIGEERTRLDGIAKDPKASKIDQHYAELDLKALASDGELDMACGRIGQDL